MVRYIISFVLLIMLSLDSDAQYNHIAYQGKIEYEFKINRFERAKKLLSNQDASTKYRDYILSLEHNRFLIRNYQMDFDRKNNSYQLMQKEEPQDFIDLLIGIPTVSVFCDLENDSIYMEKQFGDDNFFIAEKFKKIKWKYTDERMDILGYECRRVNGLFMDSIYVVAFYSPDIDVSSGPSIFSGLPGMILGVSIPQEHLNIFAKKIYLNEQPTINFKIKNNKTEKSSFAAFGAYLKTLLGNRFDKEKWDMNMRGILF